MKIQNFNYLLFLPLLFILRCSSNSTTGKVIVNNIDTLLLNKVSVYLSSFSKLEFQKLKSSNKTNYAITSIKKNKNEISLPLKNSKNLILKDSLSKTDNSEQVTYIYKGYLQNIGFYVILAQYYETGEYILINDETGSKKKIWGEPIVSADHKSIVDFSNAVGYDVMPNGIQLWEIQQNKELKLKWEYQIDHWGADSIEWIDEKSIGVKKIIPDYISTTKVEEINYIKMSW
jgi:hypothetical protein